VSGIVHKWPWGTLVFDGRVDFAYGTVVRGDLPSRTGTPYPYLRLTVMALGNGKGIVIAGLSEHPVIILDPYKWTPVDSTK
jgi:hypothetical protein